MKSGSGMPVRANRGIHVVKVIGFDWNNPFTRGATIGVALCVLAVGLFWAGLDIHATLVAAATPKVVTVAQLEANRTKWLGYSVEVQGTLKFVINDEVQVDGNPYVDGRFYSLSDGGHSVSVYQFGQRKLKEGQRAFRGTWLKTPEGVYRLEPEPGADR